MLAQWEGDKVTIWTSTQVPFQARDGVCETLELPTNRVRIIVPHMGGGFGGKCGFHYEAHVAALARAAKRPVRLVFTREEEFLAPDRRREGMIVEIKTRYEGRRNAHGSQSAGAARQRRLHRRRIILPPYGFNARSRSVQDRQRPRRGVERLHEPSAVRFRAGTDGPPSMLGARVSHRRAGDRDWDGSGGVSASQRGRYRGNRRGRSGLR